MISTVHFVLLLNLSWIVQVKARLVYLLTHTRGNVQKRSSFRICRIRQFKSVRYVIKVAAYEYGALGKIVICQPSGLPSNSLS